MTKHAHRLSALLPALLLLATLAACSGKKEAAAPVAAAPAATQAAAPAPAPATTTPAADAPDAAPKVYAKKDTFDCDDRTVILEATCNDAYGPHLLMCTQQTLTVKDHASGAVKATREFVPVPAKDSQPAAVDEKIGAIACVRASSGERHIVTEMFNGGNCEQCEWFDWDGTLRGTSRDRGKPNAVLEDLIGVLYDKSGTKADRLIGKKDIDGFYSAGTPE
jgi:hypothetical protein